MKKQGENLDLMDQIQDLIDQEDIALVHSEEELQQWVELQQAEPAACSEPCDRTASTCFLKETPINLLAVSINGFNAVADFSRLHCVIEPCTADATINIPGCPMENVQARLNAVRLCGRLPYRFNFTEAFTNGCTNAIETITAAGQGTACIDQTLCYIPEDEFECPVDLCRSQINVRFRQFVLCEDKFYVLYNVNFIFPECP